MILAAILYTLGVFLWFLRQDSVWEGGDKWLSVVLAIFWPILAVWIIVELAKDRLEDL